jgi:hypothetical protein
VAKMAEGNCSATVDELINRARAACSIASSAAAEVELRKVIEEAKCHCGGSDELEIAYAIIMAAASHGLPHLIDELHEAGFNVWRANGSR